MESGFNSKCAIQKQSDITATDIKNHISSRKSETKVHFSALSLHNGGESRQSPEQKHKKSARVLRHEFLMAKNTILNQRNFNLSPASFVQTRTNKVMKILWKLWIISQTSSSSSHLTRLWDYINKFHHHKLAMINSRIYSSIWQLIYGRWDYEAWMILNLCHNSIMTTNLLCKFYIHIEKHSCSTCQSLLFIINIIQGRRARKNMEKLKLDGNENDSKMSITSAHIAQAESR